MSEMMVNWLEKKYKKSKEKFYNTKGSCCLNTQVKNFVKERGLDDSDTDTAGYGASDKLTTGMSITILRIGEGNEKKEMSDKKVGMPF